MDERIGDGWLFDRRMAVRLACRRQIWSAVAAPRQYDTDTEEKISGVEGQKGAEKPSLEEGAPTTYIVVHRERSQNRGVQEWILW